MDYGLAGAHYVLGLRKRISLVSSVGYYMENYSFYQKGAPFNYLLILLIASMYRTLSDFCCVRATAKVLQLI